MTTSKERSKDQSDQGENQSKTGYGTRDTKDTEGRRNKKTQCERTKKRNSKTSPKKRNLHNKLKGKWEETSKHWLSDMDQDHSFSLIRNHFAHGNAQPDTQATQENNEESIQKNQDWEDEDEGLRMKKWLTYSHTPKTRKARTNIERKKPLGGFRFTIKGKKKQEMLSKEAMPIEAFDQGTKDSIPRAC